MKIFGLKIGRQKDNESYQRYMYEMFRYLNTGIPAPIADNPTAYITSGFAKNPLVYSIISLRANAAKSVPWVVYKVTDKPKFRAYSTMQKKWNNPLAVQKLIEIKSEAMEEIESGDLVNLLNKPSAKGTFQDLVEQMFMYRDVTGNTYVYKVINDITGKVIGLHILPADKVRIIGGTFIDPVAGYVVSDLAMTRDNLQPDNVLHWKYPNPLWGPDGRALYGMSPLRAAAAIITQDNMAIQGQSAAFQNEGLKGILTGTDQTNIEFTPEQAKKIRDNFMKQSGYKNKNNMAFNRAPLNWIKVGESPVDLGVETARKNNKEILCNIFRIHPSLLSSDASTLNNLVEARKALMTMSVLPDMESLKWHLNNQIVQSHGPEYYIDYDITAIPELQEDSESLARTLGLMDWITDNEKREATNYGRYEHEGADKIYKDMGKMPLGEDIDTGFDTIDANL